MIRRGLNLFQVFGMRYRILFFYILVIISTRENVYLPLEIFIHYSFDRAENTADSDANKEQDLDDRADMHESNPIPLSTGTVKKHMGVDGTLARNDNQISSSSPGFANTMTKLNSSPSRKAFSVQDKVYVLWLISIIFMLKQIYIHTSWLYGFPFVPHLISSAPLIVVL
jgi:hypothetical protein